MSVLAFEVVPWDQITSMHKITSLLKGKSSGLLHRNSVDRTDCIVILVFYILSVWGAAVVVFWFGWFGFSF